MIRSQRAQSKATTMQYTKRWQAADGCNSHTYYGTPVDEVELNQLMFLDGRYESAEELKTFIQHQIDNSKYIFMNPGSERSQVSRVASYSNEAINLIRKHPTLRELIKDYEARKTAFILPDIFYDELHRYLLDIYDLGYNEDKSVWNFEEKNISQMEKVFNRGLEFQAFIDANFSDSDKEFLSGEIIIIPIQGGAPYHERLEDVLLSRGNSECILFKQLVLWKMLDEKRSDISLPEALWQDARNREVIFTNHQFTITQNDEPLEALRMIVLGGTLEQDSAHASALVDRILSVAANNENRYEAAKREIDELHTQLYRLQELSIRDSKIGFFQGVNDIVERAEPAFKAGLYHYASTTSLARQGVMSENTELAKTFRRYAGSHYGFLSNPSDSIIKYRGYSPNIK
ncbi:MAG: hypothetical protein V4496_00415 [Pseudomonadota bacterium]